MPRTTKREVAESARVRALTNEEQLEECRTAWATGRMADYYATKPCVVILWPDTPAQAHTNRGHYRCIKHDVRVEQRTDRTIPDACQKGTIA